MKKVQVGRLAMRQEGDNWVAYYAMNNTMDGALTLGSIKMSFIEKNGERKNLFMDMMRECVDELIDETTGAKPTWGGAVPAPEIERSGRA